MDIEHRQKEWDGLQSQSLGEEQKKHANIWLQDEKMDEVLAFF